MTLEHTSESTPSNMTLSLSSSVARDELSLRDRPSGTTPAFLVGQRLRPRVGALAVLKPVAERLVATVSRDATDGTEVWKTVAYMLLDCLINLSRDDKHGNILLTLVRHGFLGVFVQDIKDSDRRLQSVLKPEPGIFTHFSVDPRWLLILS
jgi:nuclear pore complex protein Nup205